ncbi:MAG: YigZ family protein [Flavobacteriaceae bacterium]
MERSSDSYKTLMKASQEVLFKERKSKFYGYAYPISFESEIKPLLNKLRDLHPTANHICYAWQLGVGNFQYRVNDDGEPSNSS